MTDPETTSTVNKTKQLVLTAAKNRKRIELGIVLRDG